MTLFAGCRVPDTSGSTGFCLLSKARMEHLEREKWLYGLNRGLKKRRRSLDEVNKKFFGVQGHASRFSKKPLAAGGKKGGDKSQKSFNPGIKCQYSVKV